MGTAQTYSYPDTVKQIQLQYNIIKIDQSGIAYIQERSTSKEYILKQFTTNSLNEFQNLEKIILKKKSHFHQHVLQIKQTYSRSQLNFCSNVYKIFMILQYPFRNLFQQIQQRRVKKYEWFTENELWSILYSCSLGIRHLYSTGSNHQLLCSSRIYIEKDGIIKIGDPFLLDYSNKYVNKNSEDHFYPSPEELKDVKQKNNEGGDIFSLGMILLEAINLQCMQQIYEAKMTTISYKKLNDKINKISMKYSRKLQNIIRRMLVIKFSERISIKQIEQIIQNQNFQEIQEKQSSKSTYKQKSQKTNHTSNFKIIQPQIQYQQPIKSNHFKTYAPNYNFSLAPIPQFTNYTNLPNQQSPYTKFKSTYQTPNNYINSNNLESYIPSSTINMYNYKSSTLYNNGYNNGGQLYTNPKIYSNLNYSIPQQNVKVNNCYVPRVDITYNKVNDYNPNNLNSKNISNSQMQILNSNFQSGISSNVTNLNPYMPSQKYNVTTNPIDNSKNSINQAILKQLQLIKQLTRQDSNVQSKSIKIQNNLMIKSNLDPNQNLLPTQQTQHKDINPISQTQSSNKQIQQPKFVTQVYEYGSKYQGYKLNGMRHGFGKFYYQDGGFYEGEWKQNKMNGYAKLYYQNGQLAYEGNWINDQFHGKGKVFNDNPKELEQPFNYQDFSSLEDYWIYYSGDFLKDAKHGNGSIKLSNGQIFEGQFQQDVIKGQGKFYCLNGQVIEGIWQDSKLIGKLKIQQ